MAGLASLNFGDVGGAVSEIFGGIGQMKTAKGYSTAAGIAMQNAELARQSTAIQAVQAEREIYQSVGGTKADIAGAGLAASGSALDVIRSSAQQGSLTKQLIQTQGTIQQLGYQQEAASYSAMASASKAAGKGGILGGALKLGGAVASAFAIFSDERMKTNIKLMYRQPNGLGIYRFSYLGDPEQTTFEGVMAHEVKDVCPAAVHELVDGTLKVDYDMIGVTPKVIENA